MFPFAVVCGLAVLVGCGGAPATADLEVTLRSDMLAGQDFVAVVTEITADDGAARSKTLDVNASMDFVNGVLVAKFDGLQHGDYSLRVKLIGANGRLLAFSDRVVTLTRTFMSTVSVNRRTCDDVTCGGGEVCVNGACLAENCVINPSAPECSPDPVISDAGPISPDAGPITDCMNGVSQACTTTNGFGSCAGTQLCAGNAWGACNGPAAQAEIDDDADNDCDNKIDEGICVPTGCTLANQCNTISNGCGGNIACACPGAAYEKYLVGAAGRPLAYVLGGRRINLGGAGITNKLYTAGSITLDVATFDGIAHQADLVPGAPVYVAGGPGAYLLTDNRLYPVSCIELVSDNGSTLTTVSQGEFDSHALGPALGCK